MEKTSIERKFLVALLAIVVVITLLILYPFLAVFIVSGAIAVMLDPIYKWINKHITRGKKALSSLITITLFLIVLCIPIFLLGSVIFNQTQDAYYSFIVNGDTNSFLDKIDNSVNRILPEGFSFDSREKIVGLFSLIAGNLSQIFTSTVNTFLMAMLGIFSIFYLLKDGRKWKDELAKMSPLSERHVSIIISDLKSAVNRIFKGTFLIAIIQAALAWFGLYIFGVPNPALWGVLAGICSFLPTVGTSIVMIPAAIFLLLSGNLWQGLALFGWYVIIVSTIDNILSPYLISKKSEIPPLFILFAIIGGVSLMGAMGIIIGPLVLSLLYTLVDIYREEIK